MAMTIRHFTTMVALSLISTGLMAGEGQAKDVFTPDSIAERMQAANDYLLNREHQGSDRDWVRATWYSGVTEAYNATGDERYLEQAKAWGEKHQYQIGNEKSGFNRLFCSMTWLELNLIEPDTGKVDPTAEALAQDEPFSPVVGKVWYGHDPYIDSMGCVYADGLYSASAFPLLYEATGDEKYLDYLHDAYWSVIGAILDKEEDLVYRDPSYIGKKTPDGAKVLWSRGNGWVFAGLARVLRSLPEEDPAYDRYLDLYKRMAKAIAERQSDDGFWRANLGDPAQYPMPESSGTAFFVAGYGWGLREGILDKETYLPVVMKAWVALDSTIQENGKMGWVQPVDAAPRPSLPQTTHEYAVGLFLSAGSEMLQLAKAGMLDPALAADIIKTYDQELPPAALASGEMPVTVHPLAPQINTFLERQPDVEDFQPTGFKRNDYLDVIAGQVKAIGQYQNEEGRIIDPVAGHAFAYATPCYAHSVAVLAHAGYPVDDALIESGMKAMDVASRDMAEGTTPDHHIDFYGWPVTFAYQLFEGTADEERRNTWREHLSKVKAEDYSAYGSPLSRGENTYQQHKEFYETYADHFTHNWNVVNVGGEFMRSEIGVTDLHYVDYCLGMQMANVTPHGLYLENGEAMAYDLFARYFMVGMMHQGYRSHTFTTYRDVMWKGAWTSMFMLSPEGEAPTGYRSTHHIWNEAESAVIFEAYASAYAKAGRPQEAGAFKRAANLSLASIKNWIRPDGSGYVVKNRYPKEAMHGYEAYTVHSCYNLQACSMLAVAWQFSDDSIEETPSPADVGGFAFAVPEFHKVFANVDRNYIQYDTDGDQIYNPTGLLRIHLKGGHPQLGPSDGCGKYRGTYYPASGASYAVGPAWKDTYGRWTRLADLTDITQVQNVLWQHADHTQVSVNVIAEETDFVKLSIDYRIPYTTNSVAAMLTETLTVRPDGVYGDISVDCDHLEAVRMYYPMLVFDGATETDIQIDGTSATLTLDGKSVQFEALDADGAELIRTGKQYKSRNGMLEPIYFDMDKAHIHYRIGLPETSK